jgi:hypothetical protein
VGAIDMDENPYRSPVSDPGKPLDWGSLVIVLLGVVAIAIQVLAVLYLKHLYPDTGP